MDYNTLIKDNSYFVRDCCHQKLANLFWQNLDWLGSEHGDRRTADWLSSGKIIERAFTGMLEATTWHFIIPTTYTEHRRNRDSGLSEVSLDFIDRNPNWLTEFQRMELLVTQDLGLTYVDFSLKGIPKCEKVKYAELFLGREVYGKLFLPLKEDKSLREMGFTFK